MPLNANDSPAFRDLGNFVGFLIIGTLFLSGFSSALAFSPHYNLEFETDVSREVVKPSLFPWVGAGLNFNSGDDANFRETEKEYIGDLNFRISPTHPKAYTLSSRNLYWGEKDGSTESPLRFTYGRRLVGWTKLDSLWGLGSIEPLNSWDRLRSFSQGLTGIFAFTETGTFQFRFFLSYLFLPESTPNIVLKDDQFQSEHPQANSNAPQTINLVGKGKPTPLGYRLDIPALNKIFFRPSYLFSMETKKDFPISAKFVYGVLPLNYFPVAVVQGLDIASGNAIGLATLSPRLINHTIFNFELAYHLTPNISFGGVDLIDLPNADLIGVDQIATPLTNSNTMSPFIEYEISSLKIILSQIWTNGGLDADLVDGKSAAGPSVFSSRLLYRKATQVAINTELGSGSPHPRTLKLKYIHEYSILADWISGDFNYYFEPSLNVFIGADLIGAIRSASPDRGAEYLADLRTNDRIRFGVNYVF